MNRFRKLRNGYTDLGPIQIPPRAQAVVLTDRADGTLYLVSFNRDESDVLRLSLNTTYASIQRRQGVRVYNADEGPYMDEDGKYMLLVREGQIGFEYNEYSIGIVDRDQAPPYARTSNAEKRIILDDNDVEPGLVHIGLESDG